MSHVIPPGRKAAAAALPVLLLACIGLAACGSSSTKSTSTNTATSAASTGAQTSPPGGASGPSGPGAGRFAAVRECLAKNGITLPRRAPGQRPGGRAGGFLGAGPAGAGPQLPKGVTRAQYEAALKKCGGFPAGGRFRGGATRLQSPAFKQALKSFASCLRQNGVNIPEPNTSGKGPIFSTKGIKIASPQFRAADSKCRGVLAGAFRAGAKKTG